MLRARRGEAKKNSTIRGKRTRDWTSLGSVALCERLLDSCETLELLTVCDFLALLATAEVYMNAIEFPIKGFSHSHGRVTKQRYLGEQSERFWLACAASLIMHRKGVRRCLRPGSWAYAGDNTSDHREADLRPPGDFETCHMCSVSADPA